MRKIARFFASAAAIAGFAISGVNSTALAQDAPYIGTAWKGSTPEAEGLDPAPLLALDSAVRAGAFDNVDRLVVVRNGKLVMSERFPRDYRQISSTFDMRPHQFNYQHPDWHPY